MLYICIAFAKSVKIKIKKSTFLNFLNTRFSGDNI